MAYAPITLWDLAEYKRAKQGAREVTRPFIQNAVQMGMSMIGLPMLGLPYGVPKNYYHGSTKKITNTSLPNLGESSAHPASGLGTYFTENPAVADRFIKIKTDAPFYNPDKLPFAEGANVSKYKITPKNPKVLEPEDFIDLMYNPKTAKVRTLEEYKYLAENWRKEGFDSIIIKGNFDKYSQSNPEYAWEQIIPLVKTIIK